MARLAPGYLRAGLAAPLAIPLVAIPLAVLAGLVWWALAPKDGSTASAVLSASLGYLVWAAFYGTALCYVGFLVVCGIAMFRPVAKGGPGTLLLAFALSASMFALHALTFIAFGGEASDLLAGLLLAILCGSLATLAFRSLAKISR